MGKYYFASDFHLGAPNRADSLIREKEVVAWLEIARVDATEIFILGDVFDFWYEYKTVVPRGYTRLLGKLSEIVDSGIPVHWFTGNHDMWIFDYIPSETGVKIYREPVRRELNGKKFFIGHGDGLGPGDHGYKLLKKIFSSRFCQWVFARLHPNFGIGLANYFSTISRKSGADSDKIFLGKEKEWLAIYSEEIGNTEPVDLFVFGHRHLPMDLYLDNGGRYINLGDWISHFTYGILEGDNFTLKAFKGDPTIYSNKP